MRHRTACRMLVMAVVTGISPPSGAAQVSIFPYVQNFDSVTPPALPPGWVSTQNRTPGVNDFVTSSGTAFSAPHAALSTNATIGQTLITPLIDFTGYTPDSLRFYLRRSTTHQARVLVEASLDSGVTFAVRLGDTLRYPGHTNYVRTSVALPETLSTSRRVRCRWRILPDSSGSSGTLRLDDVRISARVGHDLSIASLTLQPQYPVESEPFAGRVRVRNAGTEPAASFSVQLFLDANQDSVPQPWELLSSVQVVDSLRAGDSVDVVPSFGSLLVGDYRCIVKVTYPPDQDIRNNTLFAPVVVGYRPRSVVVNEIMYAPTGTEPEWVELRNVRLDSVILQHWMISDNNVGSRPLITTLPIPIPPSGYVLLTANPAALLDIHPGITARIIGVPGFPILNNTGDAVILYDQRGAIMDSVSYLPAWGGNTGGRSLERIDPYAASQMQSNWGSSLASARSTPGLRNSLSRKGYDLRVDTLVISPSLPVAGDSLTLTTTVSNVGLHLARMFTMTFFHDLNGDTIGQASELLWSSLQILPLLPNGLLTLSHRVASGSGRHVFLAAVEYAGDEDTLNNRAWAGLVVSHPPGSVRINEVMYAPSTGVPEFVELINTSPDSVDLRQWKVGNRSPSSRYVISSSALSLLPSALVVLTKDTALLRAAYPGLAGGVHQVSALPTFLWNNNGDAVVLSDSRGLLMDSLFYLPAWGGSGGKSLERIDPDGTTLDSTNWGTSVDAMGGTPARPNSIVLEDYDLRAMRGEYSATERGVRLSAVVRNAGKRTADGWSVRLYHDRNRDSIAQESELLFPGPPMPSLSRGDSARVDYDWIGAPSGFQRIILSVVYAPDERRSNNMLVFSVKVGFEQRALVINEIMYAPFTGEAEYVEVVNPGENSVDMSGWTISDRPTQSGSVNLYSFGGAPRMINAGEYAVLVSDSSVFRRFPHLGHLDPRLVLIVHKSSLGLNNDGDDIVLRDITGEVIDSVSYHPSWHNPGVSDQGGRSLEKIHPGLASTDGRNWTTCTRPAGGTPGQENSVHTAILPAGSRLTFSPNPFSPDGDGHEDFTIIQFELPSRVAILSIKIFDVRGRLIRRLASGEPAGVRGQILWDGRDDEGQKARIGMYVVLLEAADQETGGVHVAKGVVVLGARL